MRPRVDLLSAGRYLQNLHRLNVVDAEVILECECRARVLGTGRDTSDSQHSANPRSRPRRIKIVSIPYYCAVHQEE
jgi:hypothetical protein